MSDTDSFINEVTEEVRRDKLYGYLRKYGWIAVVCVLAIVGGAAYNEVRKANEAAVAQATGDALLAALGEDDEAARAQALTSLEVTGPATAVTALMAAAAQEEAGDAAGAVATLSALAVNPDVPEIYRDVAAFKAALKTPEGTDPVARRATLEGLAQPGAPFALLAQEQLALMDIAAGDTETAIATLTRIAEDAGVSRGLRDRAQSLMVALGVDQTTPDTQ